MKSLLSLIVVIRSVRGLSHMRTWTAQRPEHEHDHDLCDPSIVPIDAPGFAESYQRECAEREKANQQARAKMLKVKPKRKLTWTEWNSGDSTDCWAGKYNSNRNGPWQTVFMSDNHGGNGLLYSKLWGGRSQ